MKLHATLLALLLVMRVVQEEVWILHGDLLIANHHLIVQIQDGLAVSFLTEAVIVEATMVAATAEVVAVETNNL
jgi:hypothetical protein